jgi:hypothetical protein
MSVMETMQAGSSVEPAGKLVWSETLDMEIFIGSKEAPRGDMDEGVVDDLMDMYAEALNAQPAVGNSVAAKVIEAATGQAIHF